MTSQGVFECRQHVNALLTQRGEIAANTAKSGEALLSAKTAGDFLLNFNHAQITLRLIVAERHAEVDQKGQHLPFVGRKPIQQITKLITKKGSTFFRGNHWEMA